MQNFSDDLLDCSRFLGHLFASRPEIAGELRSRFSQPISRAELQAALERTAADEATLERGLRELRQRTLGHLAMRDLVGLADLEEVMATMTALAETTIAQALRILTASASERHGAPRSADGTAEELIVVGMGKLGGGELNVSSDIDLIFVYPEEGTTDGRHPLEHFEFFTRLGRRLIGALSEPTEDGQVFRVDMRLRPDGAAGALVTSFAALEHYLISQGREWERYAWIKARPLSGGQAEELLALVRPFVYRKYLDFGAINAMQALHAQIRQEVTRRDLADNIKLGPGGIREIEFIAQVFQLIRGGRERRLQIRPTLQVLEQLAARELLEAAAARELSDAYRFLRRLEHRLQYLDDAQTHSLPGNAADRERIARAMGHDRYPDLEAELAAQRRIVSRHFDAIFANSADNPADFAAIWHERDDFDRNGAEQQLERLGFHQPAASGRQLEAIRQGSRYRKLPTQIRERFDALVPRLIGVAARMDNPDETLERSLDLIEAISRRGAYLALLQQYPQALERVARLASASSWAAEYLRHHPVLLDELLDVRRLEAAPDWPAFRNELARELDEARGDTERQMDRLREAHHAQVFRLLLQDLAGLLSVEKLADHLSELADTLLDLSLDEVWRQLPRHHRAAPRFAIVAYGKLGGKELGYASDLDIIFLYEDDHPEAADLYAQLARRLITWISSTTPAGILFRTDLRLRPNGESGLLVSSLDAFQRYQREAAWVWEHQALTRARFSAGDAAIGRQFETIRIAVLRQPRALDALRDEVLAMRRRMAEAHANRSELFDIKHDRGGLIDVEFVVQYLVLGHAHRHARLTENLGNIALLGIAAELGLIDAGIAADVQAAYRRYRILQHGLRLNGARYARVAPATLASETGQVRALWRAVFGED